MLRATVAIVSLLAVPMSARAEEDRSSVEAERVEAAPQRLFAPPGPIYDDAGRLVAAPPPPKVPSARDLWRRLPPLPQAEGEAGSDPRRTSPRRRGAP